MRYLLVLFIIFVAFSVKADIQDVPKRDLKNIKYLFEELILEHDFAYTIFGSKPMSLADMCLEVPPGLPIHRYLRSRFLLAKSKRCLNSWYNYKNELIFKDFIFLDKEYDLVNCLVVVLINKKNLLDVLQNHETTFKQELGDSFTPETFLEYLDKRKVSLAQAIHKNQRLLGIMLGYGESNATLFQERFDLMKAAIKMKKENLLQDNELIAKLNALESQLGDFSDLEEDAIIPPLYFLADISHPETIELKRRYEKDRQKIEEMMKQSNFMDKVMQRLVE